MNTRVKYELRVVLAASIIFLALLATPVIVNAQSRAEVTTEKTSKTNDKPITDIAGEASSVTAERSANNLVLLAVGVFGLVAVTLTAFRFISHTSGSKSNEVSETEE